jgi:NitT/TauT family transport system substrate-binding protein
MVKMNQKVKFHRPLFSLLVLLLASACSGAVGQPTPTAAPLTIRVAYTSDKGLSDIPNLLAQQRLSTQGYVFQPTFYASGELALAALAQGQADLAYGAPFTFWIAIGKGAKVKLISEKISSTFLVAGISKIQSCTDFSGQRVGINSTGAFNTALIKLYITQNCPSTEPQLVVVSGSDTRAAAMLAGQLDASLLEISDWEQLNAKAPGQFHIIMNFAQDLPQVVGVGLFVNEDFAAQHPEAVKAYLRANLEVNRDIAADHSILLNEAVKQLDIEADTLRPVVEDYFKIKAWDVNGGSTDAKIKANVDFLKTLDGFDQTITPERGADLSYLNAVLGVIGRK